MKLVYGVGVNDATYTVNTTLNGKRVLCPFYRTWSDMLARCYSPRVLEKQPTYRDCSVCEEWHLFSNFRAWMEDQPWEAMRLDKDLKFLGNKVYSPETCSFIPNKINSLLGTCAALRGEYPIGVSKMKIAPDMINFLRKPFLSEVQNSLNGKRMCLGMYETAEQAHAAWQKAKISVIHEYIYWWQFNCSVSHTFNQKIASSLFEVTNRIQDDFEKGQITTKFYL